MAPPPSTLLVPPEPKATQAFRNECIRRAKYAPFTKSACLVCARCSQPKPKIFECIWRPGISALISNKFECIRRKFECIRQVFECIRRGLTECIRRRIKLAFVGTYMGGEIHSLRGKAMCSTAAFLSKCNNMATI